MAYFLENRDLNAPTGALGSGVLFVVGIGVYESFENSSSCTLVSCLFPSGVRPASAAMP